MLTSLILSLAVNVSPAPAADINELTIIEAGTKRGTIRVHDAERAGTKRGTIRVGTKRGTLRVGTKRGTIRVHDAERAGTKRGTIRVNNTFEL